MNKLSGYYAFKSHKKLTMTMFLLVVLGSMIAFFPPTQTIGFAMMTIGFLIGGLILIFR